MTLEVSESRIKRKHQTKIKEIRTIEENIVSGIAFITDSNSGITQEEAAKYGVYVLPMPFMIDEQTYYEGTTISPEEFY